MPIPARIFGTVASRCMSTLPRLCMAVGMVAAAVALLLTWHTCMQGEATAVQSIVDSIDECLRKGGCVRVPGLPEEQYVFTLVLAVVAGLIAGFSSRLQPNDVISKRWFWPILFAPLWGTIFVSFGLGPVISRTDEWQPVVQNTVAFLVTALVFRPNPIYFKEPDP